MAGTVLKRTRSPSTASAAWFRLPPLWCSRERDAGGAGLARPPPKRAWTATGIFFAVPVTALASPTTHSFLRLSERFLMQ